MARQRFYCLHFVLTQINTLTYLVLNKIMEGRGSTIHFDHAGMEKYEILNTVKYTLILDTYLKLP